MSARDRPEISLEVDRICDDFESAWVQKPFPRIEDYVARSSADARQMLLRELLLSEWEMKLTRQLPVQPVEYESRFPEDLELLAEAYGAFQGETAKVESGSCAGEETILVSQAGLAAGEATDVLIPGYEILGVIGSGGMGVVYEARQLRPSRIVALKMIRLGRFASDSDTQRFVAEVNAVARLEHPNVVSVYEIGSHRGEYFFTMQLVSGANFDVFLKSGEHSTDAALEIFHKVCEAVAYCHSRGVVHRDLKPANILLDEDHVPMLTDFGLAKDLESVSNLTQTGDLLGTPGYMPPEQTNPESPIDERADVYLRVPYDSDRASPAGGR